MALTKIKLNEIDTKADPVLSDCVLLSDSADGGRGKISTLTDLQTLIGGGGGCGAVDSVAGKTGVVTLDASDIAETAALKILTADERTKLAGIAEGAEVNTVDSVAGKTGDVTLDADDIAETAALKILTADERTKLSGIAEGAEVNTVDSVAGKTGDVTLDASDVSPTSSKLWMSDTQSTKLAGIAENANNYTHPETHPQSMIDGLADALAAKAPLASPALTGTPTAPTAAVGTNTTQLATTSFVSGALAARRPKHQYVSITTASTVIAAERGNTYGVNADSCTFTLPTVTTSGYVDGDEICLVLGITNVRTVSIKSSSYILRGTGLQPTNTPFNISGYGTFISFTKCSNVWIMGYPEYELSLKAPLASPALTGTPTAPTPAAGTNTTQLATTAFVQAATASAIYDLPVTRSGLVSSGTDVVLFETDVLNPSWYDRTHVLNVSFFARNTSGLSNSTTFRFQIYDTATSTAYTVASIAGNTEFPYIMQASLFRSSSGIVNCNASFGPYPGIGSVSIASGSYKLRVVCTSTESIEFYAAQVRFTK